MWLLDFYTESIDGGEPRLQGSIGIENGRLVYSSPSLERLIRSPSLMIKFDLNDPEKAIKQMSKYFTGHFHAVPHGTGSGAH